MAIQLKDVPHIGYRAEIIDDGNVTLSDYQNYFRIYKKSEETVEENSYYSYFKGYECIFPMQEDFNIRSENAKFLCLTTEGNTYLKMRFKYDFSLAAVNAEYYTDGEFKHVKSMIDKALEGTNLFLCFMVSHFSQLAGKPLKAKTEHYHLLIGKTIEMSEEEYTKNVNLFISNLEFQNIMVYEVEK